MTRFDLARTSTLRPPRSSATRCSASQSSLPINRDCQQTAINSQSIPPCVTVVFWCPCMGINLNVQYNGEYLPDIFVLPKPLLLYGSMALFPYIITAFLFMYCIVFCFCCVSWPGMAINVSVQYNDGSLPDIILLTQGCYHWGTHLNPTKRSCF